MNKRYMVFVGIGFELVGIILACLYLGYLMDQYWGTKGLGIAGVPLLGLVGWLIHVVALTRQLDKLGESAEDKPEKTGS